MSNEYEIEVKRGRKKLIQLGKVETVSEVDLLREENRAIRSALVAFMHCIDLNGEWDNGCFYYNQTSASEFQTPIKLAQRALSLKPT